MIIRKFNKIIIYFMLSMIMALVAYYISQNNNFTTQELAEIAQVQLQKKKR